MYRVISVIIICLLCLLLVNFSHHSLKKAKTKKDRESLHRTYTILKQYLYTDQILLSYSSDSSQKFPLKFIFWTLFLKLSNSILE